VICAVARERERGGGEIDSIVTFFIKIRLKCAAVSGIVGVGNLSLSALLARLKAFQLP